ncbi:hypothetical protein E4L96_14985 [Massilia arenosa]|uniref:Putative Flp pilus-assembly TadG-like N-terminal domain-containing protein n=1 Tax=Zemynaea arenosa TaxID=2561931 RepID=A0A4Y9S7A2_9BURK|nr:pilus assembly protein TadG-related protein [Massilia arenosa]TFW17143.1 hypothetical protein E4L96_14985 [Massilia arenosa]
MTRRGQRQAGSLSIAFAVLLIIVVGVLGMGVNLALITIRRAELQNVADDAALAAAHGLDGSMAGLAKAQADARTVVEANRYNFGQHFEFSVSALSFATSLDTPDWKPAGAVNAGNVETMRFVRVDAGQLDASASSISLPFFTPDRGSDFDVSALAVAGPTVSQLAPLAICAIDKDVQYGKRSYPGGVEELVEFGFRRGVSYNLLDLNPLGGTPQHFLVNPLDEGDAPLVHDVSDSSKMLPFACAGMMPLMNLDRLHVSAGFPADLALALNGRFDDTSHGCQRVGSSAPDANIKQYDASAKFWMGAAPILPGAKPFVTGGGARLTIADPAAVPAGVTAADYGYLWAYVRPVHYDAAAPDRAGAQFSGTASLALLYPVASGSAVNMPIGNSSSTDPARPYPTITGSSTYRQSPPGGRGSALGRRVLHVPLLRCPVSGNVADVAGIGRFLMMNKSNGTALWAEFGGLDPRGSLGYNFAKYQ